MRGHETRRFHERYGFPQGTRIADATTTGAATDALAAAGGLLKDAAEAVLPEALEAQDRGDHRLYRAHLMMEELGETLAALATSDETALGDALGDLAYVVEGTAETYDLPLDQLICEIHASNMSKTRGADDPRMRAKGNGYTPPNIPRAIERGREIRAWAKQMQEKSL